MWVGKVAEAEVFLRKAAKDGWDWFKFSELCFQVTKKVNVTWKYNPYYLPAMFLAFTESLWLNAKWRTNQQVVEDGEDTKRLSLENSVYFG